MNVRIRKLGEPWILYLWSVVVSTPKPVDVDRRAAKLALGSPHTLSEARAIVKFADAKGLDPWRVSDSVVENNLHVTSATNPESKIS